MAEKSTIAIWCEKAKDAGDAKVDFHINLWHFSDKRRTDFFELGIMPDNPKRIKCIKIFIPIDVTGDQIEDLGKKFISPDLAQGIFNEPLSCKANPNGQHIELSKNDSVYCNVHVFSSTGNEIDTDELHLNHQSGGTLLTITSQALQSLGNLNPNPGYYRLRIKPNKIPMPLFLKVIKLKLKERIWIPEFDLIEYIDCRVNEARTLPIPIERAFQAAEYGVAKTKFIAFVAVVPVVSSVTMSHKEWAKSRLLERKIWENYAPQGFDDDMVVYHWKKEYTDKQTDKNFIEFSAFIKMQIRKSEIMPYLIALFLLAIIIDIFLHISKWISIYFVD